MKKTYTEFISMLIREYEGGKPIYSHVLAKAMSEEYGLSIEKAAAATAVACKRIMKSGVIPELRSYQKGIYYRAVETPFGERSIDKEQLIADKYLAEDNGYETGLFVIHQMGLTTQIPRERILATNKAKECARKDKKLDVMIRPPKVRITAANKYYLKLLDVLEMLKHAPVDATEPYVILSEYVQKQELDYQILLAIADRYYNRETVMQIAHMAGSRGEL